MSEPALIVHDDGDELADAVCARIERIARRAVAARGHALLVLPGGRSPIPVFERLRKCPLPWERLTILPTDDRLVTAAHPLSNAALLARHFRSCGARVVPLVADAVTDHRAAGDVANAVLHALAWPPDLVWLGVGADGHTASIFPGPNLREALSGGRGRRALGVLPDPLPLEAPVPRVTLTRTAICSSRQVLLSLSGDDKRNVVERALWHRDGRTTPIGHVLACARMPLEIHWSPT